LFKGKTVTIEKGEIALSNPPFPEKGVYACKSRIAIISCIALAIIFTVPGIALHSLSFLKTSTRTHFYHYMELKKGAAFSPPIPPKETEQKPEPYPAAPEIPTTEPINPETQIQQPPSTVTQTAERIERLRPPDPHPAEVPNPEILPQNPLPLFVPLPPPALEPAIPELEPVIPE
jgi:hypothetical protein